LKFELRESQSRQHALLYRTLFQPFLRASASAESAEWFHKLNPSELPFELFSGRSALALQSNPWSTVPPNVGDIPMWALEVIKQRY